MPNESRKEFVPNTARRSPSIPPANSVRTLRRLLRLRNVLGWCFGVGLGAGMLTLFLTKVPGLKADDGLLVGSALAFTLCWVVGLYGVQFVQSCLEEHIRRRFRLDHIHGLTYWSNGVLPRGKSVSLPWSLAGAHMRERTEFLNQLSLLTEDTAYLLWDRERRALYKILYGQDDALISAALRAIPVFGDAHALPSIRHLAEGNGAAAENMKLRTVARSSLHRLQAVLDLAGGSHGLLRASHAPEEHLLHPVQANRETDPNELLRADLRK